MPGKRRGITQDAITIGKSRLKGKATGARIALIALAAAASNVKHVADAIFCSRQKAGPGFIVQRLQPEVLVHGKLVEIAQKVNRSRSWRPDSERRAAGHNSTAQRDG